MRENGNKLLNIYFKFKFFSLFKYLLEGLKERKMEQELIILQIKILMKDSLIMDWEMEKEFIFGQIKAIIKEIGKM